MNNYKVIAMIPARLGSKRIPKKNIRYLLDKPLIQYPIELAIQCDRFDSIWVNTESEELGRASQKIGANFHKRPEELATDTATNREFTYEFMQKHECDYVVMINATSPLLKLETLNAFLDYVDSNCYDTVVSVIKQKEETFYQGKPLNFSLEEKVNSQLLEPTEAICWALTAWKRDNFMKMQESGINPVYGGVIGRFSIPKNESCDLDTLEDWKIAEGMLMAERILTDERYMDI